MHAITTRAILDDGSVLDRLRPCQHEPRPPRRPAWAPGDGRGDSSPATPARSWTISVACWGTATARTRRRYHPSHTHAQQLPSKTGRRSRPHLRTTLCRLLGDEFGQSRRDHHRPPHAHPDAASAPTSRGHAGNVHPHLARLLDDGCSPPPARPTASTPTRTPATYQPIGQTIDPAPTRLRHWDRRPLGDLALRLRST